MSKAVGSLFIMVVAAVVGFILGAYLNDPVGGMILLALISGIACIIYAIDKKEGGK